MRFWKRAESEMERELAHHLWELEREYERRGYGPEEAKRMAKREFGGVEQVKEGCRDERRGAWLQGVWQDAQFGWRMMKRTPVVTVAAVVSLALGIGANTAVFSLADVVLWKDLAVPRAEQLSLVHWTGHGFPRDLADGASGGMTQDGTESVADFFAYPAYERMRDAVAEKARLAAYSFPTEASVSWEGRPAVAQARPVSAGFFGVLGVRPQIGRLMVASDDGAGAAPVVVLSHRFWKKTLGGRADVAGKTMRIDNRPYVVAGVLEEGFHGLVPGDESELYVTLRNAPGRNGERNEASELENPRMWVVQILARRAEGVTAEQLRAVMGAVFPSTWDRVPKEKEKAPRIRIDEGRRGLGDLRREFGNPLLVLGGLVVLLLAIACANIANLLLARAVARQREVALRVSLGCSQWRLMRQFLTESLLLAGLGGIAAVGVAWVTANGLGSFLGRHGSQPVAVELDARVWGLIGLSTLGALVLFGLFPAWRGARLKDATVLRPGAGSRGRGQGHGGQALLVVQMALSVVLVLAAVLFTRNLMAVEGSDPGFDRRNLVMFGVRPGTSGYEGERLAAFYSRVEERLSEVPGVEKVGLASFRPMNLGGWWAPARIEGRKEKVDASMNGITPGYLSVFQRQTAMRAGRGLTWQDYRSGAKVAVISEDLARELGGGAGMVGQRIQFSDEPGSKEPAYEVVGVAPAMAATSMKERPAAVWLPLEQKSRQATVVVRTTRRPSEVFKQLQAAMAEIDRELPLVEVITMEEQIAKGLQRERMFATLCGGFGVLALVLSGVGLYGVMAYGTTRRRSEIGVRLALGAMPGGVMRMVLKEGLVLAGLGMGIGLPAVWLGAKYVEKELYKMKPLEPMTVGLALGLLGVCAVAAVVGPAWKAARLEPAETLREE